MLAAVRAASDQTQGGGSQVACLALPGVVLGMCGAFCGWNLPEQTDHIRSLEGPISHCRSECGAQLFQRYCLAARERRGMFFLHEQRAKSLLAGRFIDLCVALILNKSRPLQLPPCHYTATIRFI